MTRVAGGGVGRSAPREMHTVRLYDEHRDLYYTKPLLRGWLHLVWFGSSLVLGPLLLAQAHGALALSALAIYAGTVTGLFGTSALYHRGNWGPVAARRLQRLDHTMIFFSIAGTATPVFLLTTPSAWSRIALILMWSLTLLASGIHLVWMHAPEVLVGATFIGLGSVAALALPAVWTHVGVAAAVLLLAGGLLYIAGALSYYHRWPDPAPKVFGYHEVFHAYVCAAAACQFVSIAVFIA